MLLWCAASSLPGAGGPVPVPLLLRVNEVERRETLVRFQDGDALVEAQDLADAGLIVPETAVRTLDGRRYVSLASVAPKLSYEVEERRAELRLTAPAELFAPITIDLRPGTRPRGLQVRGDASAFLNYAVKLSRPFSLEGFGELGVSMRGALLESGASFVGGRPVRGVTSLTYDRPGSMQRLVVGDATVSSGLGGAGVLAGLTVSREFGLDPYFIRASGVRAAGAALTPSMLDVYVNGALVRQERLAPGPFELSNLPVASGSGSVSYVLHDAFGRTQEVAVPYYFASGVLGRGVADYAYSLGFRRLDLATASFRYGPPALVARHRYGLTDALTLGGALEAGFDGVVGGPSLSWRLPRGFVELSGAASVLRDGSGASGSVAYSVVSRLASAGAFARAASSRYRAGLVSSADPTWLSVGASASVSIGPALSWGAEWQLSADRERLVRSRGATRLSWGQGPWSVVVSASREARPDGATYGGYAMVSRVFGERTSAFATLGIEHGSPSATLEAQQSVPYATGFGYRVMGQASAHPRGLGTATYQGDHGRVEALAQGGAEGSAGYVSASGALVVIGGGLFATRPIQGGYALVEVPGLAEVPAFVDNRPVGVTDARGQRLVPNLLPYYGNRLGIDHALLPPDWQLDVEELSIAPMWRGGAVVRFPARPIRAVVGRLTVRREGRRGVPAFGRVEVRVGERLQLSPVGGEGAFYFDDLPPGRHDARVVDGFGACGFTLEVPALAQARVDLGELTCEPTAEGTPADVRVQRGEP